MDERLHLSAHIRRNRLRAPGIERNQSDLVTREKLFLATRRAAHLEFDRRLAEPGDGKLEPQQVPEVRRPEKFAARIDDREADPPLQVHLVERQADRIAKPVLDHAPDHVEEIDEVDDPRGIAVREADQPLARERRHYRMRLNQASESAAARSTRSAAAAEKKAPTSVFFVSITRREFIDW